MASPMQVQLCRAQAAMSSLRLRLPHPQFRQHAKASVSAKPYGYGSARFVSGTPSEAPLRTKCLRVRSHMARWPASPSVVAKQVRLRQGMPHAE